MIWSQEEADDTLASDVGEKVSGLDRELPWWRALNDARQDVLANMAFNLGLAGLLTFTTFLGFLQRGLYAQAALDLLGTRAAHELPARYHRLAHQLSAGVVQP